jgi:two-component system, NarL family, sensor kinase
MQKNIIILGFLMVHGLAFGQITSNYQQHLNSIDSLKKLNAQTPEPTSKKARIYMYLTDFYLDIMKLDSSLIYAQEGIRIAQEAKDYAAEARMWGLMASSTYHSGDFEQGIEWATKSLEVALKTKKDSIIFSRYNILGLLYLETNKYQEAKSYFEKSLEVFDKMNNQQKSLYSDTDHYKVIANLAEVYENINEYDLSIKLHEQSFQEAKKLNGYRSMAIARSHQAFCYQQLNLPKKAIEALEEGLIYSQKISDLDISNYILCRFVDLYLKINQLNNAEKYLNLSLEMEKDSARISKSSQRKLYSSAIELYKKKNDFQKAFFYKQKATIIENTFYNEKASNQLVFANIKFKIAEKNEEILQKQKAIKTIFISTGIIILIIIGFFYFQKRRNEIVFLAQKQIEMRSTMIETQENERQRVAKDLHDSVGAMLATVKNQIEGLKYQNIENGSNSFEKIDKIMATLQDTSQEVRRISHNLIPIVLLKFDLAAALENLCHSVETPNLELSLVSISQPIEKEKEILLYRIVQEVVANAIKYADASNIYIQMIEENKKLLLQIEDDGKGFNLQKAETGMGIKSMKVRTEILNGKITIDTAPQKGTIVIVEIPV